MLAGATIALCYFTPLSYLYCLARQKSWTTAKTEAQLDRRMAAFYTKQSISLPMWGHVPKPGERRIRYLIFSKEPFDVVLDNKSRIVAAFSSYE